MIGANALDAIGTAITMTIPILGLWPSLLFTLGVQLGTDLNRIINR